MPKRKRLPFNKADESRLGGLSVMKMRTDALKIICESLHQMQTKKTHKRHIRFRNGELEKVLQRDRIEESELLCIVDGLFKTIKMSGLDKENKIVIISLFEKFEAEQKKNGYWSADLILTQSAVDYIFTEENVKHISYLLKNVTELTCKYSYSLYMYLEKQKCDSWVESVETLKMVLDCTAPRYDEFKFFNSEVLKKAWQEINEKTSLKFDYISVYEGRRVCGIRFMLHTSFSDFSDERLNMLMQTESLSGR